MICQQFWGDAWHRWICLGKSLLRDGRNCQDSLGVLQGQQLRYIATQGHPDNVGMLYPVSVKDADGVIRKVLDFVRGGPGLIARRSTSIPVVISKHETSITGQGCAELVGPPCAGCSRPHDKKDSRILGASEALRVDTNTFELDDSCFHARTLTRLWRRITSMLRVAQHHHAMFPGAYCHACPEAGAIALQKNRCDKTRPCRSSGDLHRDRHGR